jgi:hypothetical protein
MHIMTQGKRKKEKKHKQCDHESHCKTHVSHDEKRKNERKRKKKKKAMTP